MNKEEAKLNTILIVDDCSPLRESLKDLLGIFGYQSLEAENGKKALEILSKNKVDLILLDHNMPVMNGLECLKEIKTRDDLKSIPIISITNDYTLEDIYLSQGVNWFRGPSSTMILMDKIKEILRE